MNNTQFKIDDAADFITQALDDFLRDKKLKLSAQQYGRLKKLLMVSLLDQEMSYSSAYSHLSELIEYRKDYEIDANAPDEAEEEMIRIIGAADAQEIEVVVESTRFKKRFMIAASLLLFFCIGFIGTKTVQHFKNNTIKMASVITTTEETQLKELVRRVVEVEKNRGITITHNAVYNKIKKLEGVTTAGDASSYKKFNYAQLGAATDFLNEWIAGVEPAAGGIQ